MITEQYVSFEVAKLLKDKGFPQDDTRILNTCYKYNGKFCNNVKSMSKVDREISFMAPTQSLVMRWLREVHNLFIEIKYGSRFYGGTPSHSIRFEVVYSSLDDKTSCKNMLKDDYVTEYFNTYEQACESAIKYCLENLI